MPTWMHAPATFQVMPKTPATPGPPGMASPLPSPSNPTIHASSLEASRNFMPSAPILPNPPGTWLHPHQIGGFARPSFSPYAAVIPGPYPIRSAPPQSAAYPDIQPPGVSPAVSGPGASTALQTELPPGIGKPRKFDLNFLLSLCMLCISIML